MALLPLTNAQRIQRFGAFRCYASPQPKNPEHVTILDGWAEQHITQAHCPQLAQMFGRESVSIHRKAKQPFLDLWQAWDDGGLLKIVETFDGTWVPRFKRGRAPVVPAGGSAPVYESPPATLSNHAWGNAFDINARLYPLGKAVPEHAPIRRLFEPAMALGWFPGAFFQGRPDGMHFEYVGAAPPHDRVSAARALSAHALVPSMTRAEIKLAQELIGVKADGDAGKVTMARVKEVLGAA